jgi:hypothetical protein
MGVLKRFCFVGLLVIAAIFAQDASALPLPYSTYGADYGWAGYKDYSEGGLDLTLTFNVYDIIANPSEITWAAGADFPEGDRYVYAYQLFCDPLSTKDVSYFRILDKSGNPIAQALMHATQGVGEGVLPNPNPSPEDKQGEWVWSPGGYISKDENSAYLVFSSIYAPTRGKFEVKASEQSEPPVVPEPATIALFCFASGFLVARRNIKRRTA